ncbi:AAA family ATPase [Bacillus paranthracis]|uniref:ATP-dependent DNA helicase n=1 Tax=Bacillus paranthracis TaxID=2026186 RepID=UPI002DD43F62|nr:AAA family ATPase [Bacillus paranthracis]MEC4620896.1 AAA family ATPase [Bacillus paranthracis]
MTKIMTREDLRMHLQAQINGESIKQVPKPVDTVTVAEDIVDNPKPVFNVDQTTEPVQPNKRKKKRDIVLTPSQQSVVSKIKRWYSTTHGYGKFELAGFAGVGKSTVVDFILEELGIRADQVRMCAPTGTASLVLKEKTPGYSCSTLHRLFFVPELMKDGRTRFVPSAENLYGVRLIIGDEFSMTGRRMAEEILPMAKKAGCKVLIVGDPGQLPPVKDEEYFFVNPDAILTEVLRQAADNPIVALSMAIRQATENGAPYIFPNRDQNIDGKVFVVNRSRVSIAQYAKVVANGGVVIAGMNKTRQSLNQAIRLHLGFNEPVLMDGETVVIKENIDGGNNGEIQVTNGMRGTVSEVLKLNNGNIKFKFTPESFDGHRYIEVNEDILFERKTASEIRKKNKELKVQGKREIPIGVEVQFGYVITGHSSQGSQWKTVYVINESGVFNRGVDGYKNANRWLYTVVTRAVENLVIVR